MTRPRLRLPGSETARLTALYGGLLVLAGGALIGLVYSLVRQGLSRSIRIAVITTVPGSVADDGSTVVSGGRTHAVAGAPRTSEGFPNASAVRAIASAAEKAALSRLLTVSLLSLAAFAALSIILAWWMAGRVLRPVGVITATARRLSGENLHERIRLKAPPGELKQLADTFDDMLARIEQLVTAQQRFVANAAHELRTPLAVQRAAAEIGLADPELGPERLSRIRGKLIDVAEDSERLIDQLLLLSTTDQGLQTVGPVQLDAVADQVTEALTDEAQRLGVIIETRLEPLTVNGEAVLLHHLLHNLLGNAIRYNHPGGQVTVQVGAHALEVSNTGPPVPPEAVSRIFEPFHRLHARRAGPREGAGLGLSIVASIARAHGADATATANPDGGLTVHVTGWNQGHDFRAGPPDGLTPPPGPGS
ncbi:sensor histidine kinase [Actinacidiphila oryziradicis]|uniref:histidine kinase n=1 Tax=Actinacidiphila oryziradicis TaxID=2571141 RepID=A0A4U0S0A9_9ACTN|nr:ATP-binding protein [Actinacidiphila oryziradicis]TKA02174.1 HAMP domain-containing protein [Actinacidiphila oryziradicis]